MLFVALLYLVLVLVFATGARMPVDRRYWPALAGIASLPLGIVLAASTILERT